MTPLDGGGAMVSALDDATVALVRAAAALSSAGEDSIRAALEEALAVTPPVWMEELLLQTYLFAGFPRALNGMRMWRRLSGRAAPLEDRSASHGNHQAWARDGERTCAIVYGPFYDRLRRNITALHPALDQWMITDGYGKVLARPELDLKRRELCVVATCAASGQDRQLHSHLHGALHAGATRNEVTATLEAVADYVRPDDVDRYWHLWAKVSGK
jgi:4-carboxymuconolactone decarboxylase